MKNCGLSSVLLTCAKDAGQLLTGLVTVVPHFGQMLNLKPLFLFIVSLSKKKHSVRFSYNVLLCLPEPLLFTSQYSKLPFQKSV
jgi:hypothetical protein